VKDRIEREIVALDVEKIDLNMLNKVLRFARMVDGQIIINTKT